LPLTPIPTDRFEGIYEEPLHRETPPEGKKLKLLAKTQFRLLKARGISCIAIMKVLVALLLSALAGRVGGLGSTDTITWGGDNSRTGYQT
jgi:hypothetical protein